MSVLSAYLSSTSPKAIMQGQPGSNGYWRRDIFRLPGTYTWTAKKSGFIKIQAIGAASGGSGNMPGASGAFGEKVLWVNAGDTLTLVLGAGGIGVSSASPISGNGGSTSISGTPVGGTALTLVGATGVQNNTPATGAPGSATGPWDISYPGAKSEQTGRGSPSSGSPFGPGKASSVYNSGGAGWGGGALSSGGASTHAPGVSTSGTAGFLSRGGDANQPNGESQPFWDLRDADGGGGAQPGTGGGGNGGVGAGGGYGAPGGISPLGGGTGVSSGGIALRSGHGAGGGQLSGGLGGDGGDAYIQIFWDEVSLI